VTAEVTINIAHYASDSLFRGCDIFSKHEKNFKEIMKKLFIVKVHITLYCNTLYFVMMLNNNG
jgi:hypothetical protein